MALELVPEVRLLPRKTRSLNDGFLRSNNRHDKLMNALTNVCKGRVNALTNAFIVLRPDRDMRKQIDRVLLRSEVANYMLHILVLQKWYHMQIYILRLLGKLNIKLLSLSNIFSIRAFAQFSPSASSRFVRYTRGSRSFRSPTLPTAPVKGEKGI